VHVGSAGGLVNGHCWVGEPGGCTGDPSGCFAVCRGLIKDTTAMTGSCEEETRAAGPGHNRELKRGVSV
jgi:hypothetical protein